MFKKIKRISSPVYWYDKVYRYIFDWRSSKDILDLDQSQWWSYHKLVRYQNDRLRKMINYAYYNIPAYRSKFDIAGVKPGDIKTQKDLNKIPITERTEMQNNGDFINKKLISTTLYTGGSTGIPLQYHESSDSEKIRWKSHFRGWSWNGYSAGKRMAILASAQGVIGYPNILVLKGDLKTGSLKNNIRKLQEFKPEYIRGYVGSIYILAKYCIENNIKLAGIKVINPISENLYGYQREIMKKAFGCEVFEEYCCNDGGACAWECNHHDGLHYFMERAIIEEIDGEMIVTDLWNKAMPFIRYRNGDWVKFTGNKCSCKRQLPLIKVKGRTNDLIVSPRGPVGATYLMLHGVRYDERFRSGIRAVQYIQKPDYNLYVNIVKNQWCKDKEISDFNKAIRKFMGGMKIHMKFVKDIPTTKKGKRSFIINEDKELLKKYA